MRVIVVSPRVAPGILTLEAWDALRSAGRVLSAEDGPHVQGIRSAGIDVEISPDRPGESAGDDVVWIAPPGDLQWARDIADSLVPMPVTDEGRTSRSCSAPTTSRAPVCSTSST